MSLFSAAASTTRPRFMTSIAPTSIASSCTSRRRTLDAELALDLTGETFALALERRAQFRGRARRRSRAGCSRSPATSCCCFWKRGEVERAALQRIGCDPPEGTTADIEWVERVADLPALRATVRFALDDLPPRPGATPSPARVVDARDYADIAGELDVSEQVVRARVSRGLRAMAETLSDPALKDLT